MKKTPPKKIEKKPKKKGTPSFRGPLKVQVELKNVQDLENRLKKRGGDLDWVMDWLKENHKTQLQSTLLVNWNKIRKAILFYLSDPKFFKGSLTRERMKEVGEAVYASQAHMSQFHGTAQKDALEIIQKRDGYLDPSQNPRIMDSAEINSFDEESTLQPMHITSEEEPVSHAEITPAKGEKSFLSNFVYLGEIENLDKEKQNAEKKLRILGKKGPLLKLYINNAINLSSGYDVLTDERFLPPYWDAAERAMMQLQGNDQIKAYIAFELYIAVILEERSRRIKKEFQGTPKGRKKAGKEIILKVEAPDPEIPTKNEIFSGIDRLFNLRDLETGEILYGYQYIASKDLINFAVSVYGSGPDKLVFTVPFPCKYPVEFSYSQLFDAFTKGHLESNKKLKKENKGTKPLKLLGQEDPSVIPDLERMNSAASYEEVQERFWNGFESVPEKDIRFKTLFKYICGYSEETGFINLPKDLQGAIVQAQEKLRLEKKEFAAVCKNWLKVSLAEAITHQDKQFHSYINFIKKKLTDLDEEKSFKHVEEELTKTMQAFRPPVIEPAHPGPYLKERFYTRSGMPLRKFAENLKLPHTTLAYLFKGSSGFTPYLAAKFKSYYKEDMIEPLWMQVQLDYFRECKKQETHPDDYKPSKKRGRRPKKKNPSPQ